MWNESGTQGEKGSGKEKKAAAREMGRTRGGRVARADDANRSKSCPQAKRGRRERNVSTVLGNGRQLSVLVRAISEGWGGGVGVRVGRWSVTSRGGERGRKVLECDGRAQGRGGIFKVQRRGHVCVLREKSP